MQLAIRYGYTRVEIQVDSQVIAVGRGLVARMRNLLDSLKEYRVYHIFREANKCAEILAGMDCNHQSGLVVYEQVCRAVV